MDGHGNKPLIGLDVDFLKSEIQKLTACKRLWIAYSGGLDSHVLLDAVVRAFADHSDYQINALHIHHGISPNADTWVKHCKSVCYTLKIPLSLLHVDGNVVEGRSPEEVAREARFKAFEAFLSVDDCLLLAHHADDQAETILLRLCRGTGPLGLGGMLPKITCGNSEIIKPLLQVSKSMIREYAEINGLQWIEDESNTDNRFDRNFIRQDILPKLSARWPHVVRSINRAGSLCLETAMAATSLAEEDLNIVRKEGSKDLSVAALLKLDPVRRRGVLRYWLQHLGFKAPSRDHLERIDREVLKAKPGSHPRLKISAYELSRLKDNLTVATVAKSTV